MAEKNKQQEQELALHILGSVRDILTQMCKCIPLYIVCSLFVLCSLHTIGYTFM